MTTRYRAALLLSLSLLLLATFFSWSTSNQAATVIRANQINLGDVFAFTGNNTHAGTETFNGILTANAGGTLAGGFTISGFTIPNGTSGVLASGGSINLSSGSSINSQSSLLISGTIPTISSGFGTSPSVVASSSSASFTINVGGGGSATNGVIGLPAAQSGWNVYCEDITTFSTTVFRTRQTATTTTTATVGNFNTSASAAAWAANDVLSCVALAR